MNKLIVKAPLNSTSLGNVSLNFLKEFYKKNIDVCLFPHQDYADVSVYDRLDKNFANWISESISSKYSKIEKDTPTFQVWHINGSTERHSNKSILYTFYELDQPTLTELKICKSHDKVIFSSSHSQNCFKKVGLNNCAYSPLGFDEDFFETGKQYLNNVTHFGLMGKLEKRKHTLKILNLWAKHYGNNPKYLLSCAISNSFMKQEDTNFLIGKALNNEFYDNINFIPFMQTNSEVNDFMNSIDIDLTGLSGGEGWNLPSFNSTCLGKWSCVLNATSHLDWANRENSCLVMPEGTEPVYDNLFFTEGAEVNQGNINTFSEESFLNATKEAISKSANKNQEGLKLKEKFSYKNSVESILSNIF